MSEAKNDGSGLIKVPVGIVVPVKQGDEILDEMRSVEDALRRRGFDAYLATDEEVARLGDEEIQDLKKMSGTRLSQLGQIQQDLLDACVGFLTQADLEFYHGEGLADPGTVRVAHVEDGEEFTFDVSDGHLSRDREKMVAPLVAVLEKHRGHWKQLPMQGHSDDLMFSLLDEHVRIGYAHDSFGTVAVIVYDVDWEEQDSWLLDVKLCR